VGVTVALCTAFIVWLLFAGRRGDARAVAGFTPDCLLLFRRLLADDRVPRRSKLLLAGLIAYLAMPFDPVPDFIPVRAISTTRSSSRSSSAPSCAPVGQTCSASTGPDHPGRSAR
jgi:Protein of unknown function (DUF1232)